MEISRGYHPIFKTTIKGLARVKLHGRGDLSGEKINQIIALNALRENESFTDYPMRVYDDAIRFDKNQYGSTLPEIPYSSITRLVVLPNFPDVCFIHFRRNAYKMYMVFRVRKVDYLLKLAKIITTWNEANFNDSESAEAETSQFHSLQRIRGFKLSQQPANIQRSGRPLQSGERVTSFDQKNHSQSPNSAGTQTHIRVRLPDEFEIDEPCEFVCIKHNHKQPRSRPSRRRNQSQPTRELHESCHRKKRYHSEPRFRRDFEVEILEDKRPRFPTRPGKYTTIIPTVKNVSTPKVSYRHTKGPQERVIIAQMSGSSSKHSSSMNLSELLDIDRADVRKIFPSPMDPGKMSPKSRRNERLLHMLQKPLNDYELNERS